MATHGLHVRRIYTAEFSPFVPSLLSAQPPSLMNRPLSYPFSGSMTSIDE